jgi:RHS repeat-associated protein
LRTRPIETNPNVDFRYGYTGREWDEETGLYYYRTRYYDPTNGRFISEDTIGFNGGDANLYRYVGNNPVNLIDPYGRSWLNNVDNWLADRGVDLYGAVNTADQIAGGFASGATGGATDIARQGIYGGSVNDNQQGIAHDIAAVGGDVASDFVPGGKGSKLVKAGRGLLDKSRKASDLYRKAQSADRIFKGCGTLDDLEELASGLGNNGRRGKSGGNDGGPPVSGLGQNGDSLLDPKARKHILDGDGPKSGGHRYGTGKSGKSEFPQHWNDEKIEQKISDIATDPNVKWSKPDARGYISGSATHEGVDIKVVVDTTKGRIVTGFPTNLPKNP